MNRRRIGWIALAAVTLGAVVVLFPAAADWLVTRDGSKIETDGPWEVENRLVVFKRPDGTYSSLRLSNVDLEASERLTREMAERLEREEKEAATGRRRPARRESVARLTEKDLPPVTRESDGEGGDRRPSKAEEGEGAAEAEEQGTRLEVSSWQEVTSPGDPGVVFVGEVRNRTERAALGVEVVVTLFDDEGEEIASAPATLTSTSVPPGRTVGFRAELLGTHHYEQATFAVSGDLVLSGSGVQETPVEGR